MNIKRLIAAGAAGAMILGATAVPALAHGNHHWWHHDDDLTLDIDNDAWVDNDVYTKADTGDNYIGHGEGDDDALIDTGKATAVSVVTNDVNFNLVDLCGCLGDFDDVDIDIDNDAHVDNDVYTKADTGDNYIGHVDGAEIYTGNASATGVVENIVNTNIVGSL